MLQRVELPVSVCQCFFQRALRSPSGLLRVPFGSSLNLNDGFQRALRSPSGLLRVPFGSSLNLNDGFQRALRSPSGLLRRPFGSRLSLNARINFFSCNSHNLSKGCTRRGQGASPRLSPLETTFEERCRQPLTLDARNTLISCRNENRSIFPHTPGFGCGKTQFSAAPRRSHHPHRRTGGKAPRSRSPHRRCATGIG